MPGKKGENKGIAHAKKDRKREEAEARNTATKPENRRQYRLAMERGASTEECLAAVGITNPV